MDHIAYPKIRILATEISVKFAIIHYQVRPGAIFKIILKVVLLKMVLIAITYIRDFALQM